MSRALVVLSGGQDSTTCLYWTMARFGREHVASITFDYGQRHRIELACAQQVAVFAGVPNTILPINTFAALGGTCYNGQQPPCGECPACVLRAKGFVEAGIADPLVERFQAAVP